MFLFKRESRNQMDGIRDKGGFSENYQKLFGLKLPDMDTVNLFLKKSSPQVLEKIKHKMVQCLLNKKVLRKFLVYGTYMVAVDGSGIGSYPYEPWPGCPFKESKNGTKTWLVPILEAKMVFNNGLCLSLCTEWMLNTGNFDKQDCELKAFLRLSERLKTDYPRLPITILADGLYPNKSVFGICKKNQWGFMITLKDKNLKTLWEDINFELLVAKDNYVETPLWNHKKNKLKQSFRFLNNLEYNGFSLNWIECCETTITKKKAKTTRFVTITNLPVTKENVCIFGNYARQRWNIDLDGFDIQKNHGYGLEHKYSRCSLNARQNYYQCLQIAHIINQLAMKVKSFVSQFHSKDSDMLLWECIIAFMMLCEIEHEQVQQIYQSNCQLRY
jgi:hypothetical protein